MDDPVEIGRRIAEARRRCGLNKNQLARALGTSWQHVDRWEKGRTAPGRQYLSRLASLLGVTVDALIGPEASPGLAEEPEALVEFLHFYAPADLTDREVAWLRQAPLEDEPTPGDYLDLLRALRRGSGRGASTRPPPPKSGNHLIVDRDEVMRRLRVRGTGSGGSGTE